MKTNLTTESIRTKYPPKGTQPKNQVKAKDDWDEETINQSEKPSESKLPLVLKEIGQSWFQIVIGIVAIAAVIQISSNALLTKPTSSRATVAPSSSVEQAPQAKLTIIEQEMTHNSIGSEILGRVRNDGTTSVRFAQIDCEFESSSGRLNDTDTSFVHPTELAPGETGTFKAISVRTGAVTYTCRPH